MGSDMVRVGGCKVGQVTTDGTITALDKISMDFFSVTFDTGETRTMKYNQALVVVA